MLGRAEGGGRRRCGRVVGGGLLKKKVRRWILSAERLALGRGLGFLWKLGSLVPWDSTVQQFATFGHQLLGKEDLEGGLMWKNRGEGRFFVLQYKYPSAPTKPKVLAWKPGLGG